MTLKPVHLSQSPGTVLAMSWLNIILYTSQVALSIYYLRHFTATRWLRGWIFASLFIDGTCLIVGMVGVYMPSSIWSLAKVHRTPYLHGPARL